jgi:hypothetical protein
MVVFNTSGIEAVGSAMSVACARSKVCTFYLCPSVTILKRNVNVIVEMEKE